MASKTVAWTEQEVAKIPLFSTTLNDKVIPLIKSKLIDIIKNTAGADKIYREIVASLPLREDQKSTLNSKFTTHILGLGSIYDLYSEMMTQVVGSGGKTANVGVFIDAIRKAGWTDGVDSIVGGNWSEIKGLEKPIVPAVIGESEDEVDCSTMPEFATESFPEEEFFEFNETQAEKELSDAGVDVDGYFKEEILKVKVKLSKELKEGEGIYKMTSKPRGVALIINNDFKNPAYQGKKIYISPRNGCEHDEKYMGLLFLQMGFDTYVAKNVASTRLPKLMERYRGLLRSDIDCLVFVIMSHGLLHQIQMADGKSIDIYKDFIPEISTKLPGEYRAKPKLVLFQACQNYPKVKESNDGASSSKQVAKNDIPIGHIRLFFPSLPNDSARRREANGSRFIYVVAKVFMEHAHNLHFEDLEILVNETMATMTLPPDCDRQIARTEKLGLNYKLYFNPGV